MTSKAEMPTVTFWEHRRQVLSYRIGRIARLAILLFISIIILAPIVWTGSTSLRKGTESFSVPPKWIPTDFDWNNYQQVFDRIPFGRQVMNSAIITASIVMGQLCTASLAGYAFARLEFPGRNLLFWLLARSCFGSIS